MLIILYLSLTSLSIINKEMFDPLFYYIVAIGLLGTEADFWHSFWRNRTGSKKDKPNRKALKFIMLYSIQDEAYGIYLDGTLVSSHKSEDEAKEEIKKISLSEDFIVETKRLKSSFGNEGFKDDYMGYMSYEII